MNECTDSWNNGCADIGLGGYNCCTDPETGDRYCCSFDHEVTLDDGTLSPRCGDGPACNHLWCCADEAARSPGAIERCTDRRVECILRGGP